MNKDMTVGYTDKDRIYFCLLSGKASKKQMLLILRCINMELEVQYLGQSHVDSVSDLKVWLH